ncbi:MAG: hypothetical protein NTU43_07585, partial [Bacteroidetes bacterium]|nr:hypothetical protein [Bacteroidota bacterium]
NGSIILNGPANTTYLWLNGTNNLGTTRSINVSQVGVYKLVTGSGVCADTSSYNVATSTVNLVNNGNVVSYSYCPNNANVIAKVKSVGNAQNYTWYNGSSFIKSSLDTFVTINNGANSSLLKVIATNNVGCKDSLNINMNALSINYTNLTVSPDSVVCAGINVGLSNPLILGAKYYFQKNGVHYDSTINHTTITSGGNYRLILKTTSSGCIDTSRAVPINFVLLLCRQ